MFPIHIQIGRDYHDGYGEGMEEGWERGYYHGYAEAEADQSLYNALGIVMAALDNEGDNGLTRIHLERLANRWFPIQNDVVHRVLNVKWNGRTI